MVVASTPLLHNPMAAALTDGKIRMFENMAISEPERTRSLTQPEPQFA